MGLFLREIGARKGYISRDGVYRVNLGLRKQTFAKMFLKVPKRPAAGCVVDMDYDESEALRL